MDSFQQKDDTFRQYSDEFIVLSTQHIQERILDSLTEENASTPPSDKPKSRTIDLDLPPAINNVQMTCTSNLYSDLDPDSELEKMQLQDRVPMPQLWWRAYQRVFNLHSTLPIDIREKDLVYQYFRLIIFTYLLRAYPASKAELFRQASIDIPPPLRGIVWACLLGVDNMYSEDYAKMDFDEPNAIDR